MAKDVSQLKNEARREEQREHWSRAIELYQQAIRRSVEAGDVSLDLSLYNRVGDLYRRQGDTEEAVRFYREAVDRYAEQGLHTGAIALCNKILRLAPDQLEVHRSLGRLHAATGLMAEARKSFETFCEGMAEAGREAERLEGRLELAELLDDDELVLAAVDEMVEAGQEEPAVEALVRRREAAREAGEEVPEVRARLEELASGRLAEEEAEAADEAAGATGEPGPAGVEDDAGPDTAGGAADLSDILLELDEAEPTPGAEAEEPAAEADEEAEPEDEAGPASAGAPQEADGAERSEDGGQLDEVLSELAEAEEPGGPEAPAEAGRDEDAEAPEQDERGYVDLGDRIRRRLEEDREASVADDVGDSDFDFDGMLVGFRAQVEETSGEADPEAHVELGVALRQMGQLEDAIREFQVATRAPEPPLRAFELLGEAFIEREFHGVAVRVLNRGLRLPGHPEHERLGILYQLGVANQEVGNPAEALDCYERIYSVDIDFRDVAERMRSVRMES